MRDKSIYKCRCGNVFADHMAMQCPKCHVLNGFNFAIHEIDTAGISKSVGFSYPTSANADKFKMPNGCWNVLISHCSGVPLAIKAFKNEKEATDYANSVLLPWDFCWLFVNNPAKTA